MGPREPLTVKFLSARKKELIEAEGGGMLEFVQSRFDLSMVAGHEAVKKKLTDAAAAIRAGRLDVLPMGYVICGAVGTGKTFLTTCFAGEVGIPAVVLKNFRSMWQGVTEGNLERILALLRAMSPIAVIVDEAGAQLGTQESSGDSGVSNRVFAQIAQFMGNTELRGRVIWFLLTCRPDLLPVDLKRQGRAEEHLALFYPDSDDERLALFRHAEEDAHSRQLPRRRAHLPRACGKPLGRRHRGDPGPRAHAQRRRGRGRRRRRRRQGGARRLHPAVVSDGDRAADDRRRARVYEQEPAARGVPRCRPRRADRADAGSPAPRAARVAGLVRRGGAPRELRRRPDS